MPRFTVWLQTEHGPAYRATLRTQADAEEWTQRQQIEYPDARYTITEG
jgi:hypothetical protein